MPVKIGPIDPIQLTFNILNALIEKELISSEEAKGIIMDSLPDHMPEEEKERIFDSLVKKGN